MYIQYVCVCNAKKVAHTHTPVLNAAIVLSYPGGFYSLNVSLNFNDETEIRFLVCAHKRGE